jgi:DNA-binding beta-propeller fold protein YncE
MNKFLAVAIAIVTLFASRVQSQVLEPLKLIGSIPLAGLHDGDFDHFALDSPGQRLFLAAEQNAAVEVMDLRTNKLVQTIPGPKAPHSLVYRADLKKLFVVDGDAGDIKVYQGDSYKPAGSIKLLEDADSSAFDPSTKYMYVVNGGRGAHMDHTLISVVDTTSAEKIGDIKVDSDSVEALALEKSGPLMFANLRGSNAVAAIDREKRAVIATWPIGQEGKGNSAMAFDEANHRLFVIARDLGKLIVLDSDSGKIVASLPCIGQTDDAIYDPASKRLYVAGVPFVYVYQQRNANGYQFLGQVPTAFHAVTAILVPELNRYYVAVNHHGQTEAEVQIYEVVP